jgi:hypothetical protein
VQQVVDWQTEPQTLAQGHVARETSDSSPGGSGPGGEIAGDHRPSMYRKAAKEIVAAIDEELGKITDVHPPAQKP